MPAGLVVPVSGPYLGTWGALPMGVQHDDGYTLLATIQGQEVNETDQYGLTLVEAIYRGQNWRVRMRALEWDHQGPLTILQMFGTVQTEEGGSTTELNPVLNNIGDRWTKYCEALVLTAILGNPPSTPATLTAMNAGFAPQSQSDMNFTSKVREMPLEMVLIPYHMVIGSQTFALPFTTT